MILRDDPSRDVLSTQVGNSMSDERKPFRCNKSFAWRITCAGKGLKWVFSTQKNIKFYLLAAGITFLAAAWLHIKTTDLVLIVVAVALVFVSEVINSAVEKTVDLACPDYHPLAAVAKDAAAGAVLLAAFFAVIIGWLVFYPYAKKWLAVML